MNALALSGTNIIVVQITYQTMNLDRWPPGETKCKCLILSLLTSLLWLIGESMPLLFCNFLMMMNVSKAIDYAITKLCISLSSDQTNVVLSENDENVLTDIVSTDIFSNILDLSKTKSIIEFYRKIPRVKTDTNLLKPYNYNLCSIESFYAMSDSKRGIFKEIQVKHINSMEVYLLELARNFERLRQTMDQCYVCLEPYIKNHLTEIRTKWSDLDHMYMREIEDFAT